MSLRHDRCSLCLWCTLLVSCLVMLIVTSVCCASNTVMVVSTLTYRRSRKRVAVVTWRYRFPRATCNRHMSFHYDYGSFCPWFTVIVPCLGMLIVASVWCVANTVMVMFTLTYGRSLKGVAVVTWRYRFPHATCICSYVISPWLL